VDAALARLREVVDTLAGVDATTLPEGCVTRAVRDLSATSGRIDGLQARFVAAAEAAEVPTRSGATSTTDWLSETTGRSKREAARTGRLARSMDQSPELAERLAGGTVGPDQADRIARGLDRGTLDPSDAADLLEHATHLPPGTFDREARRLEGRRHQRRLREQEQAAHDARSASRWRTDDGSLKLECLVAPADGDVVEKALNAFVQPDPAEVPDDLRRSHRQLLADALVDMCKTVLQTGAAGEVAGARPHITVAVGPEMMAAPDQAERAGATGVTDLDTVLSADALQGLLCDATFTRVVLNAQGQVLDVGRATRKWPGAIRTAITALDGRDRTPGSDLPAERCEIHHITWWENGGETSVDNGVLLSPRGHAMIHREDWTLEMDQTTRICTWTSPDGDTTLTTHPRGTAARGAGAPHDIPQLHTGQRDTAQRDTAQRDTGQRATAQRDTAADVETSHSRTARAAGPARPTGRGDPGRPRGPGADPPNTADHAPPTPSGAESLQLNL